MNYCVAEYLTQKNHNFLLMLVTSVKIKGLDFLEKNW